MLSGMSDTTVWAKRVAAWRASGLTAGEFAEGRGFAEGTLRWWAWRLGRSADTRKGAAPRMVKLVARRSEPSSTSALTIEVNGARVTVPGGVDRETLSSVLAALAAAVRPL